jgi:hypothetical protein
MNRIQLATRFILLFISLIQISAHANPFSVGRPDRRWNVDELRVCFPKSAEQFFDSAPIKPEDATFIPSSAGVRKWIRDTVRGQFASDILGFEIVGFELCPTDPFEFAEQHYVLATAKNLRRNAHGLSTLGDTNVNREWYESLFDWSVKLDPAEGILLENVKKRSASTLDFALSRKRESGNVSHIVERVRKLLPEEISFDPAKETAALLNSIVKNQNIITLVHEVGHAVGLQHEHLRKDVRLPSYCGIVPDDGSGETFVDGNGSSFLSTEYDVFSVMNYCGSHISRLVDYARFVCQWADILPAAVASDASILPVFEYCDLMDKNPLLPGLSETDRAGLRKMYLGVQPSAEERDYRRSPEKMKWAEALTTFHRAFFGE